MKCPRCHFDNPSETLFCGRCGTKFDSPGQVSFTQTLETPSDEMSRGTVFAGRYEIIEELGRGGMGRVYRAEDTKVQGEVALKIIAAEVSADNRAIERFRSELKTTRMISHRNVCRMYDMGEDKGKYFIAMEYVPGEDLKSFLRRVGQLPVGKAISIASQICLGLAEAHRLGVVHRDLKPGNIMIDKEGNAKIMDFGIARSVRAKGITGEGVIIGTPEYMSPEQVEAKDVDQRSDIYSLGTILYEMLAGRTPFEGDTPLNVALKHKSEVPENPMVFNVQISDDLSGLILRCLEKDKEKRYQTADEVRTELEKIEKSIPISKATTVKRPLASRQITVKFGLKNMLIPAAIFAIAIVAFWLIFNKAIPGKKAIVPKDEMVSLISLPTNVLGLPEYDYLTDAIPSTLSTFLGQVEGMSVKVPPSIFDVDKVKSDYGVIADLYKVNTFVITSVTAESGRFYLDVKLVNAKTRDQLWSKQFNGASGQYQEMVRRAADDIRQYLRPISPALAVKEKSASSEAVLALQRGIYHWKRFVGRGTMDSWNVSLAAFQQAYALDPRLAEAAAWIGFIFWSKSTKLDSQTARSFFQQSESWARKALDVDPKCSMAWVTLAALQLTLPGSNWKQALDSALKGVYHNPDNSIAQTILFMAGPSFSLGIICLREAVRLDPFDLTAKFNLSCVLSCYGGADEALSIIEQALQIEPDFSYGFWAKSIALTYLDRLQESRSLIKQIEESVRSEKLDPFWLTLAKQAFLLQESNPTKNAATLEDIRKTADKIVNNEWEMGNYIWFLPPLLIRRGHKDLAFYILEKGIELEPASYDLLKMGADFQGLAGDPRFEKILAGYRTRFEDGLKILETARRRGELPKYLEKPFEELVNKFDVKLSSALY